ncbi:hypothetical protein OOJ91_12175 [Micromonospora lupini]|uniref:hypothetical protein n=1 Tax=Micromonospora lupini TaxID=285679 RepID=UPI00225366F5|nr:hypothetical protein [Micromonospora lupini]MCX5066635.1 hypothetical protein [Micromonospora lupini]
MAVRLKIELPDGRSAEFEEDLLVYSFGTYRYDARAQLDRQYEAAKRWLDDQDLNTPRTVTMKTIEIKGVWLIKATEHNGNGLQVLVELTDGTVRTVISEVADDGPISHYVHPAGILNAPVHDLTYAEGRQPAGQ